MMRDRLSIQRIVALAGVVLLLGAGLSFGPAVAQDSGVETPAPSNDGEANDPYDCEDFSTVEQVRAVFASEAPDDNSELDTDGDDIPCETDFPEQTEPVTPSPTSTPTDTATPAPTTTATETATETATATETTTPTETTTTEEDTTTETTAPTASVVFNNQTTTGTTVVVESVTMSEGGFIAIHNASLLDGNTLGSVVGVSEPLSAGTHKNVEVTLFDVPGQSFSEDMTLEENQTLIAMPHFDTNSNGVYDFITSNGSEDGPYAQNGSAVVDPASVTVENELGEGDGEQGAPDTELGENDEDDDGDGHVDEDDEDASDAPSNDDDDGDGAIDEDDEPDDGDDGADDFNGEAEDDDDGDGAADEDDEVDGGNSDDMDNDGDGAVDEDDEPDTDD